MLAKTWLLRGGVVVWDGGLGGLETRLVFSFSNGSVETWGSLLRRARRVRVVIGLARLVRKRVMMAMRWTGRGCMVLWKLEGVGSVGNCGLVAGRNQSEGVFVIVGLAVFLGKFRSVKWMRKQAGLVDGGI